MFYSAHRALFVNLRTLLPRRPSERRRHQARVGVTIVRAIGRACRHVSNPRKTCAQLGSVEHLQIETETPTAIGIVLQGLQIVEAAGQFEVTATLVFAVDADQLWQLRPDFVGLLRQWQLRQGTTLTPHTAVVHAAGM
ncbi:hypothetical protein D3C84_568320 [compost metagenome]